MAIIDFSFTTIKKKEKRINTNIILEKNKIGVINIKLNGEYYVLLDCDKSYKINPENYNCKGKTKIFCKSIDKNCRVLIIRNENLQILDNKHYLPFAPGCCVKGDIIYINNILHFNIKKVYIDNDYPYAKEAFNYYKDNFNIIKENWK